MVHAENVLRNEGFFVMSVIVTHLRIVLLKFLIQLV